MSWKKALLNIDAMKNKKDVVCDIKCISIWPNKAVCGINNLMQKYDDGDYRVFIKKYAETRTASHGVDIAVFAILISLFALMVSIGLSILSFAKFITVAVFVTSVIYICLVVIVILVFLMYLVLPTMDKYEAIIIAIEAAELDKRLKKNIDAK